MYYPGCTALIPGLALPYCNSGIYKVPCGYPPNLLFKLVGKPLPLKKKQQNNNNNKLGERRSVISSRLPALAPQQVACQAGGWVGEQGAAPQGEQLEAGSWLVANPNLEEGEEGLHE